MRSLADVRSWLAQPMTGAAETLAAPYWRLLPELAPQANVVIVRRPVEDVVESLMRLETFGACQFDRSVLTQVFQRADAKLTQAAKRLPNVLEVQFHELMWAGPCKEVFEHCLPYNFDDAWWSHLSRVNIQCEFHAHIRYMQAHTPQLLKLHELAAFAMRAGLAAQEREPPEGMSFQEEPFETWKREGVPLFERHCVDAGENPSAWGGKNWDLMAECAAAGNMQIVTARSNGRMFGYLMTLLTPSLQEPGRRTAVNTVFFADACAPGIGVKIQRFALQRLKERGVDEVFFRSGYHGADARLGALYKRLGAQPDGDVYRLTLNGVQ